MSGGMYMSKIQNTPKNKFFLIEAVRGQME